MQITLVGKEKEVIEMMRRFVRDYDTQYELATPDVEKQFNQLFEVTNNDSDNVPLNVAKVHVLNNGGNWLEFKRSSGIDKYFKRSAKARYYQGLKLKEEK